MHDEIWKYQENIDYLESEGIDTVCFMGTGFKFKDIQVGATFYFTYAFMGRNAKTERKDALEHVLKSDRARHPNYILNDKYVIVSKYRMSNPGKNRIKRREVFLMVKNIRTHTSFKFTDEEIDHMPSLLFETIDKQDF